MTVVEVAAAVRSFVFRFASEDELQAAIAEGLTMRGFQVEREVIVDGGRIDLLVEQSVGIEVKVAGTAAAVQAQVEGYLQDRRLNGLVLVTALSRHELPPILNGKPVITVSLARNGL